MRFERVKLRYPGSSGPGEALNVQDLTEKTLQVVGGAGFDFTVEASLDGSNWFEAVASTTGPVSNTAITDLAAFLRVNVSTLGTAPEINIYGRNTRTQ